MTKIENKTGLKKHFVRAADRAGKIRYAAAMWLLGLPLPVILIALVWRGCDW